MRPARRPDRGAIAPLAAVSLLSMAGLTFLALTVGRRVAYQLELQHAADAVALTAGHIVAREGYPRTPTTLRPAFILAPENVLDGLRGAGTHADLGSTHQVWGAEGSGVFVEVFVQPNGAFEPDVPMLLEPFRRLANARARARVPQYLLRNFVRRMPRIVVVLDFSRSMGNGYDGSQRRLDVAKDAVRRLLDEFGSRAQFGAVFFAGELITQIPVTRDTGQTAIRNALATVDFNTDRLVCFNGTVPSPPICDGTNTGAGLDAANAMIAQDAWDPPFYLVMSDGQATFCSEMGCMRNDTCALDSSLRAASQAWEIGVNIYTLDVQTEDYSNPVDSDFLISISGTATNPGSSDHHLLVPEQARLYGDVRAHSTCSLGPLVPHIEDPSLIRAFLRPGGSNEEILLLRGRDFGYEAASDSIVITSAWCDRIEYEGATLVVREDRPCLVPIVAVE